MFYKKRNEIFDKMHRIIDENIKNVVIIYTTDIEKSTYHIIRQNKWVLI